MYACNVSDFIAPTNSLLVTRECLSHQCWSDIFISKVQLSTVEIKITEAERNHFICLPKPLHPQPNDMLIRLDYAREALKLLVVVNRWQDWKNWVLYIPVYGGAIPTIQVKGCKIMQEQSIWLHIFHCNSCNTNSMRCLPVAKVAAVWINPKALITVWSVYDVTVRTSPENDYGGNWQNLKNEA